MSKWKVLNKKNDCYLLQKETHEGTVLYKVIDIEGDTISMGVDGERALQVFNGYSLERVRKEKKNGFKEWLKANVDA